MTQKPAGIDDRPEQLRDPVRKSEGGTVSERYLAKLAEKSFLNLWSYPNPYRDQGINGNGDGKELCDLLAVCGEHIVIFSEKTIDWPSGDIETAWSRWAKRAIQASAKQTKGAERWLAGHPERLFLDRACSAPFPIDLPPKEVRRVHRIVVANGSAGACHRFTEGRSASLKIIPEIIGDAHWARRESVPFAIGDIDPDGSFVHVFNEAALDVVMSELDTIRDFTDYLAKKAAFVRSGNLREAAGEENLFAYYAIRMNSENEHDFVISAKKVPITIDHQHYPRLTGNPRYAAKKDADRSSYLWDRLIETFTTRMLDGTSFTPEGQEFDLRKYESGIRHMALVPRFSRRNYSEAVAHAMERGLRCERVVCTIPGTRINRDGVKESETAFFVLTLKYLHRMQANGGYEKYRQRRSAYSLIYAKGLLERCAHLKRVIGFALEPPEQGRESSEDLIYAEQCDWTDEERAAIKNDCKRADLLQNIVERRHEGKEFPDVGTIVVESPDAHQPHLNRKQRRALKARARKRNR